MNSAWHIKPRPLVAPGFRHLCFVIDSSFVIRASSFSFQSLIPNPYAKEHP